MSDYDVVVVGSGHNGLIAAAYLAKAGQSVLVLERNDCLGGGVVTNELVAPGFRHDPHGALHILIQANPLIRNDELGLISEYGLKYHYPEAIFSTLFEDGDSMVTYADLDRTCQSIAKISEHDAQCYRAFVQRSAQILPLMVQGMFVPPPPQGVFWALLDQSPEGRDFMHVMQKSMLDIVNQYFTHDKTKIHLLKCAAELQVGPDERGTGAFIFNMAGFTHTYPWGVPEGGSGALVDALVRCLEANGAEIRTTSLVDKVLVADGKTTGVQLSSGETISANTVIGQIHPWDLGKMVDGLDDGVVHRAGATDTAKFCLMWSMYALDKKPHFPGGEEASKAALFNYAPASLESYLRVFDDLRYGDMPSSPVLAILDNAQFDPTRAPAGGSTLTVSTFCPYALRDGGAAAWDSRKQEIGDSVHEIVKNICPDLNDANIAGRVFDTPLDAERYSPTFKRGDVGGISKAFYQIGGHRPTADLAQYAVPGAQGLYLAGAFMHPPGGVTGGGRATAVKICSDLNIDFDSICGERS